MSEGDFLKEYDDSTELWNKVYQQYSPEDLQQDKLQVEPLFDTCLELFSKKCPRVLDFGCGTGDILFQCAEYHETTYGIGIDRSKVGIEFAHNFANLNHYHQLDFVTADHNYLKQLDDEDFDGIILSNVIDIIPKDYADEIMEQLTRILKKGGYLFLKINPYSTDEELAAINLVNMKDNLYTKDGILRYRRLDTDAWKKEFEPSYKLLRYIEFPYPWDLTRLNRLFLLEKK